MTFFNITLGVLLLSYSLFLLVSFFSKRFLVSELLLMLLPFLLVLNLVLLAAIFSIFQFKLLYKLTFFNFSAVVFLFVTLVLLINFWQFNFYSMPEVKASSQGSIRIAFFNKLYSNTSYYAIDRKLSSVNPDMIGFSELKAEDVKNIDYLKKYKYAFFKESRDNSKIAFFTNLPAETEDNLNLTHVLSLKTHIAGDLYRVFVIHPVPPINTSWLHKRNKELDDLADYINSLDTKNVILIGDFNLTPWSSAYRSFSNRLGGLKNSALGQGINFTWGNSLIKTQVDHVFLPGSVSVDKFKTEKIPGSDHRLIWVDSSF